jgi:hypothetical protein
MSGEDFAHDDRPEFMVHPSRFRQSIVLIHRRIVSWKGWSRMMRFIQWTRNTIGRPHTVSHTYNCLLGLSP